MRVELRIKFNRRSLFFNLLKDILHRVCIGIALIRSNILRQLMLFVGDNAIGELHALAKSAIEHRTQQA